MLEASAKAYPPRYCAETRADRRRHLHPVLEGRIFEWHRDVQDVKEVEYGRTAPPAPRTDGSQPLPSSVPDRPDHDPAAPAAGSGRRADFPVLAELARTAARLWPIPTAWEAPLSSVRWTPSSRPGPSDRPRGFPNSDLAVLGCIVPASPARSLAAPSPHRRHPGGDYWAETRAPGAARHHRSRRCRETAHGFWFSDLKGFTRLVDTVASEQVIPLLNDYADAIVSSIHEHEGRCCNPSVTVCWRRSKRASRRRPAAGLWKRPAPRCIGSRS